MDFIFCCFHVSVDTVHSSLIRSSSSSSPRSIHHLILSSFLPTYSLFRLFRYSSHLSLASLHLSVILSTSSLSFVLSFLTWPLSTWLHAHLHTFISVTPSLFSWKIVIGSVSTPFVLVIGGLNELVLFTADGKCDNNMAHLAKFLSENMSRHEKVMDESIDVVGGVEQNVSNAVLV